MKTFVKWSGNKSRFVKHILPKIPQFNTYYEPFVGSGALFLSLAPQKWVINDMNTDLYRVWYALLNKSEYFIKVFRQYANVLSNLNKNELLMECKILTDHLNYTQKSIKKSVIYLMMKNLAYNSHIYFKDKFKFYTFDLNIHTYDTIFLFSKKYEDTLRTVSTYLQNSNGLILNHNYTEILKLCKAGDFVFLDPPYIEDHNYQFVYNKEERLDDDFLHILLKEVKKLDKKRVKWLMTQADTPKIRQLFKNYIITEIPIYRMPKRMFVHELIIMNY